MLSISPQHASIVDAPATATSIFALPGWRHDERPPEINTKDWKSLPASWGSVTAPHQANIKRFAHTPTITYRRGDQVTVVTGPIVPTVPHMTDATRAGWLRWRGSVEAATISAKKAAASRRDGIRAVFEKREPAKKSKAEREAAAWARKCDKALAAGEPMPEKPVRKPDFLNFIKDSELVEAINGSRNNSEVARRLRKFTHRGTAPIGGRVYADFEERFKREDGSRASAVRSWLGIIGLQLLSSSLPKNILFGRDKEIEYLASAEGMQRLFALDNSHVILDKARRCCFIVDLDGWWISIDALRSHLRKLLPPHLMPAITTFRGRDSDGLGVENQHLIWPLPPGSRVLRGAGQKSWPSSSSCSRWSRTASSAT